MDAIAPASAPVAAAYESRVRDGALERDPAQERVASRLDALHAALGGYEPPSRSGLLGWLFGGGDAAPPRAA